MQLARALRGVSTAPVLTTILSSTSSSVPSRTCATQTDPQFIQGLKDLASDFSQKEFLPHSASWDAEERLPLEALRRAAELGFAGMSVRSDVGGCDIPCTASVAIFEALSYGDVSTTCFLTVQNMVAFIIDRHGKEELRQRILPKLTQLEILGSYCLTEPNSGSDAASMATTAKKAGENYIINGSKAFISGGGVSDVYVVMAKTGSSENADVVSAFLVEKTSQGISFGKEEQKMGWRSQPTTTVSFENVCVPATHLLGEEGAGFRIAMNALDRGRINIASCAIGGAQFCMDNAFEYSKSRKQFKTPISSFQNTQFKFADMATAIQASRLLVNEAAQSIDNKAQRATLNAAMAKRFATDAAFQVSSDAMQILGGYGYLKEYNIERYFRDLRVLSILEGTNEIMRIVIHKGLSKMYSDS